jgi:hypothetical protein
MKILVTLSGECFEAQYLHAGNADGRDGIVYCFKLKDLLKDRGERYVSMFRSGTDRVFIESYDERVATVRLNALRRAFDSGAFSFEMPLVPDNRYYELRLRAADFHPQKQADDQTIRRYLKLGGYWMGYKHLPVGPNAFVDFDCPEDFDYLGANLQTVYRNLRLLIDKRYFEPTVISFPVSLKVRPTAKLIEEIESPEIIPKAATAIGGTNLTHNIHMHGPNARINVNSTDNSTNIASVSNEQLFVRLRETANTIVDESHRAQILARLDDLEYAKEPNGFVSAYQGFIASVADYMTIFSPFIPALTLMLSGK